MKRRKLNRKNVNHRNNWCQDYTPDPSYRRSSLQATTLKDVRGSVNRWLKKSLEDRMDTEIRRTLVMRPFGGTSAWRNFAASWPS